MEEQSMSKYQRKQLAKARGTWKQPEAQVALSIIANFERRDAEKKEKPKRTRRMMARPWVIRLALLALGALNRVVYDALGLFLRPGDFRLGDLFTINNAQGKACHERCDDSDHPNDGVQHCWSDSSILVCTLSDSERRGNPVG